MAPSYRSVAASVAQSKRDNPEKFCPSPKCLWRTGGGYCPRHKPKEPTSETQQPTPNQPINKSVFVWLLDLAKAAFGGSVPSMFVPQKRDGFRPEGPLPPPPAGQTAWSDHDIKSHSKLHYKHGGNAQAVVKRMIEQTPHEARALRAYHCPVCASQGAKHFVVGRQSLYRDKD